MSTSWRDVLKVHPAAELFPMMSEAELKTLGEDIKKNGLRTRVAVIGDELLDGRNRLDAMEKVGLGFEIEKVSVLAWNPDCKVHGPLGFDPYAYVISANIHRRHLKPKQKRKLIADLLKATPEKSDRKIAETAKASPTTVGKVRAEMESSTVQSGQLRVGKDGKARKQPAKKPRRTPDDFAKDMAAKKQTTAPSLDWYDLMGIKLAPGVSETRPPSEKRTSGLPKADDGGDGVAPPEEIRRNILDSIERYAAVARSYKKILKVSSLDEATKGEVSDAIGALITLWQSLQRELESLRQRS
jgi:hypothetical protein